MPCIDVGEVDVSSTVNVAIASSLLNPHIVICGRKRLHTSGRSALPNNAHRFESVS